MNAIIYSKLDKIEKLFTVNPKSSDAKRIILRGSNVDHVNSPIEIQINAKILNLTIFCRAYARFLNEIPTDWVKYTFEILDDNENKYEKWHVLRN